jgi:DMSO/TMAO reductase YedYZ heme-binding membrane subunit
VTLDRVVRPSPTRDQRYRRWLAVTAVAYAVLHHLGLLPSGLGPAPD